jgi:hypothetical protein
MALLLIGVLNLVTYRAEWPTSGCTFNQAARAWQDSCVERLIRLIKEEEIDLSENRDYYDAYHQQQTNARAVN